jgi:hypothetical protein
MAGDAAKVRALIRALGSGDTRQAARAVKLVTGMSQRSRMRVLTLALTKGTPEAKIRAMEAAELSMERGLLDLVEANTSDMDPRVRAFAARCIGALEAGDRLDLVCSLFRDDEEMVRLGAVYGLACAARSGIEEALIPLEARALDDLEYTEVRIEALEVLRRFARVEMAGLRRKLLDDQDARVYAWALSLRLYEDRGKQIEGEIEREISRLNSGNLRECFEGAKNLKMYGRQSGYKLVERVFRGLKDPVELSLAITVLKSIGAAAREPIIRALEGMDLPDEPAQVIAETIAIELLKGITRRKP